MASKRPSCSKLNHADFALSTLSIHGYDWLNSERDVAPPIHVSTTYRYKSNPEELVPLSDEEILLSNALPVYSRVSNPNNTRFETILSSILGGHAISYSSGLAAFHAMLVFFRPKVIAISGGYHGCHGVIDIMTKLYGLRKVNLYDEGEWDAAGLGKGDLVHVETPLNPTGEATDIAAFVQLARKRGAFVTVDATFGPPPLQDPFVHGADMVMHSGTKYFGGHSDLLCGVLVSKRRDWFEGLWNDRIYLGNAMGNLEGWLGIRSLMTLEVRVLAQSKSAERLVTWLDGCLRDDPQLCGDQEERAVVRATVKEVRHASLQKDAWNDGWLKKQMPRGFGPVFVIYLKDKKAAKSLPGKLKLFHHATSLGGTESLIEWRIMSDSGADETLLRVSIGLEASEDLRKDLLEAIKKVSRE